MFLPFEVVGQIATVPLDLRVQLGKIVQIWANLIEFGLNLGKIEA